MPPLPTSFPFLYTVPYYVLSWGFIFMPCVAKSDVNGFLSMHVSIGKAPFKPGHTPSCVVMRSDAERRLPYAG